MTATRALALALTLVPLLLAPARAEDAQPGSAPPPPSFDELQAMIARMQKQVDSLGQSSEQRDKALDFLSQQVDKAAGQIGGTAQSNDQLRGQASELSTKLQDLATERNRLAEQGCCFLSLQCSPSHTSSGGKCPALVKVSSRASTSTTTHSTVARWPVVVTLTSRESLTRICPGASPSMA